MSDDSLNGVEVAEEALEKKLENLTVSDENPATDGDERKRRRRLPTTERIRLWEEEQQNKTVLETKLKGTVKWYSVLGRYGFITRDDGEKDVFVHQTAIAKSMTSKFYLRTLGDDEKVEFDLVEGNKGPEASNVTGLDGENVVGSKYRHILLSRFRRGRTQGPSRGEDQDDNKEEREVSEKSEKPKRNRNKHRRNRKDRKVSASGDAPKDVKTEEEISAGARRKAEAFGDHEDLQTQIGDRCGSPIAGLGAQAIDAQI